MDMDFTRKLPIPQETKKMYPLTEDLAKIVADRAEAMRKILDGRDDRLMLIIGPCSADNEDSVMDYCNRLVGLQEEVKDRLFIVPRIYTGKPRTTGAGYKGILHQPDPTAKPDLFKGIVTIRELHMRVLKETGFSCADEMLYAENLKYLDDVLGYIAIGARSVENQSHRLVASGAGIPVGMKNPTGGDISVMMNSITAAQSQHTFLYRGWEGHSHGNPYAHAILRGYVNDHGQSRPNYHYEDLVRLCDAYAAKPDLKNPGVIVDCNHANSGKNPLQQPRIAQEILINMNYNEDIKKLVKGFMIESYIEDGNQPVDGGVYGKSITDACIGWDKTSDMVKEIADKMK